MNPGCRESLSTWLRPRRCLVIHHRRMKTPLLVRTCLGMRCHIESLNLISYVVLYYCRSNSDFSREIQLSDLDVWVPTTTLLCSIFLPVLVKAIPCIGKDLGMSTVAYASLMVELEQDGYTSKTRESHLFVGNRAGRFRCLGTDHYLVVLCFPASACQSHPMYR